ALAHPKEGSAQDRFVVAPAGETPRVVKQIAGEVFEDEPIVGHVGVEGADEVIAVAPRVGDGHVGFVAECVAVTDEVHPGPRRSPARHCPTRGPPSRPTARGWPPARLTTGPGVASGVHGSST